METGAPPRILLDPALQSAFDRDGFAVVDFLDRDEVSALHAWWDANDIATKRGGFVASVLIDDFAYRSGVSQAIAGVFAQRQLGFLNGYRFTNGNFVVKNPHSDHGEVPLHQDPSFVDERRFTSIGFWVPLTDVNPTNGCLHVLPGSHRLNPTIRAANGAFPYANLVPHMRDRLVPLPMRAGQALIFTQRLFHGSPPNRSGGVRVVAAGIAIPRDAHLWYVYADDAAPHRKEAFAVPDDFYQRHRYGTRPRGLEPLELFDESPAPLDRGRLEAVITDR